MNNPPAAVLVSHARDRGRVGRLQLDLKDSAQCPRTASVTYACVAWAPVPRSWTAGSRPHWAEHRWHCEQAPSCKKSNWFDKLAMVANACIRSRLRPGQTSSFSLSPMETLHSNTRHRRPTHWFQIFWHSDKVSVNPAVYNLIAYWVCSAPLTKSQIHIFLNLQFKWNSKSV